MKRDGEAAFVAGFSPAGKLSFDAAAKRAKPELTCSGRDESKEPAHARR